MTPSAPLIDWLLDSDPAIRWQVMRDLLGASEATWRAERAKVEKEGWGAALLSHQDPDGQWAGGAFVPAGYTEEDWRERGQPWTATCFSLMDLCDFGLDPSTAWVRKTTDLIGRHCHWDHGNQPFWCGEVEECINGRTVKLGAYFGVDVFSIVSRLLSEQQEDGGWNCERCNGSRRSSFDTTINVLEGILEFEKATGGTPQTRATRAAGEEYLLQRSLFRRQSTGEAAAERYLQFLHPNRWRYDILRGLDYFRAASLSTGTPPDQRLRPAIDYLRSRQSIAGNWPLDWQPKGTVWFEMEDGPGKPSRWITLKALRVLNWWEGHG
ncbi:squalene cyclase [Pseudorhizobium pelagicum]|uniref:squalene cyclase n=1 Tax=Pseudorhizobium pelagicum TaxID=1509405 RepID=UPI000C810881|nr:squalene cyclase [Pseudorhizobium pelagicum]